MAANTSDKITDTRNAARPNSARATGTRAVAATSLACDNLAGWPTTSKVHFVTYQVNAAGTPVAGTQIDCRGIVSGNTINSISIYDGTDTGNSVGDYVEMLPTAAWGQDLSDALMQEHTRTGTHAAITTTSINNAGTLTQTGQATFTAGTTLPAGDIGTADLANASVTADKLSTGAAAGFVNTSETTTSTSYADLATTTDTVTVTVGANGLLLVGIYSTSSNSGADAQNFTSFALSGANTLAGNDVNAIQLRQTTATAQQSAGITKLLTGLTAGSTVVKMKYRVTGNTGTWLNRNIYAIPF